MAADLAQKDLDVILQAAYISGTRLGRTDGVRQLKALGIKAPSQQNVGTRYLDEVRMQARRAFAIELQTLERFVAEAHDGVTGPPGRDRTAARIIVVRSAVGRAVRRLALRAEMAAQVAAHRAYTEAVIELAKQGGLTLLKRWVATSAVPCAACAALDGTEAALDGQFSHSATTSSRPPPAVFVDLQGPPRHPRCRCRIEIVLPHGPIPEQTEPKPPPAEMTAAQVRSLPEDTFRAFMAFLGGVGGMLWRRFRGR